MDVRVELSVARPETETPARREARQRADRQREAEQAMTEDPMVQTLQDTFDARLVPNSIKPVDD